MAGSGPEWLAAGGTIATFTVSLWLLGRSKQRRRREEKEKRSEQARLVSAWFDGVQEAADWIDDGSTYGTEMDRTEVSYVVRNTSTEPIYSVTLRMPLGTYGTFVRYLGIVGPEERRRVHVRVSASKPVGDKAPEE